MKRCLEKILFGISCKIQAPTVDLETSLDKKKEHADFNALENAFESYVSSGF